MVGFIVKVGGGESGAGVDGSGDRRIMAWGVVRQGRRDLVQKPGARRNCGYAPNREGAGWGLAGEDSGDVYGEQKTGKSLKTVRATNLSAG